MSSIGERSTALPDEDGYTHLLGVPMDVVERLRTLHETALDGLISLQTWQERHAETLAGSNPALGPAELGGLSARVESALMREAGEDFDRFLFLSGLAANLRLIQAPDPDRELRDLQDALPTLTVERPRAMLQRRLATLQAMTGHRESEPYEPGTRMLKALRVGALEGTYGWLKAATAAEPTASVQDLVTRAAIEVAEAKLELDRYDNLKDSSHRHPGP